MLDVGLYFYVLGLSVMSLLYVLDIRRYVSQVVSMMDCVLSGSLLIVFSLFCYAVCFFSRANKLFLIPSNYSTTFFFVFEFMAQVH